MSKKIQNLYLQLSNAIADLEDPPMCSLPVYRDWFFNDGFIPRKGISSAAYLAEQKAMELSAVRICLGCPVKALCAEYAVVAEEMYGCWGGTTPASRKTISAEASRNAN